MTMRSMNFQDDTFTYFTPLRNDLKWDIMVNGRYRSTLTLPLQVGIEYNSDDLKEFVRQQQPSLRNVDFDVKLCGRPKFRN